MVSAVAVAEVLYDEAASFAEEYGIRVGAVMNWPPLAGRMMAIIMLNNGPMTVDELRRELGASAGGISECSRLLVESGVVERIKSPGTRKKSFAYRQDAWVACLQHQVEIHAELRDLAIAGCEAVRRTPKSIRSRFDDMRHYQEFMTQSLEELEGVFKEEIGFSDSPGEVAVTQPSRKRSRRS